jgi:tRNA(Ile)-lysidine synthase
MLESHRVTGVEAFRRKIEILTKLLTRHRMTRTISRRSPKTSTSQSRYRTSGFARSLLREWKRLELPLSHERIVVAVSGGADSVALLLGLDELIASGRLKSELIVAHLNHRLRGKASAADAIWVTALAKQLGHESVLGSVDVRRKAARLGDNLEQAARIARYEFLERTARRNQAAAVLTAHTMDDQAETVLLNLLRGSGARGLGGVEPIRSIEPTSDLLLARPLLSWAERPDTEDYCRQRDIEFRTDAMNLDRKFARVRVRQELLPLMRTFNPNLVKGLVRTAEILREDNGALDKGAARLLEISIEPDDATSLRFDLLANAPRALRRRALRLWLEQCRGHLKRLERVHIVAVEELLFGERGGRVFEVPGGGRVTRGRGRLHYTN